MFRHIYCSVLPAIFIPTTTIGMLAGINSSLHDINKTKNSHIHFFTNTIGFTAIGIITGILYPISFPMLGGYVIYTHLKEK
jgi:hypothetical protein